MNRQPRSESYQLLTLRCVASAAALFAFALVVWGGIVRINGAGMTCPDWPRCRGVWLPALNDPVVYEWVHRLGAPILTLLIVATLVAAVRARSIVPAGARVAWFAAGMIVAQIFAGWLTIKYANNPPSVAAHLVVGVATFATLALVAFISWSGRTLWHHRRTPIPGPSCGGPTIKLLGWLVPLTTLMALVAVAAGGYMSASNAGAACPGFPLCGGIAAAGDGAQRIHMDHRFAAYATFALVIATFIVARSARTPWIRGAATAALVLAVAQICLGVATVATKLGPVLRSVHQANAALLVATLAALCYAVFANRASARVDQRPSVARATTGTRYSTGTRVAETIRDYVALTKPNVMSLLLFTTLMSMIVAKRGLPSLGIIVATLVGGAFAAGASGALNMVLDRDVDARMSRTARRPIPSGRVSPVGALIFGLVLGTAAFAILAAFVNVLAAALAITGIIYYVLIYTVWLKRATPQNIVIGGAAGSIPPLVGWAAVTGHLTAAAILLFGIVFLWTPPHFWALALLAKEQYRKAGIPMLPVVRGDGETKRQILLYTSALSLLTLIAFPLHMMGAIYLACAIALDAIFLYYALRVARAGTPATERTLYKYSLVYLALLFVAMAVDRLLVGPLV